MVWVISTQVEINFVSSSATEAFGQQKLKLILHLRWHVRDLSAQVGIHIFSLLEWKLKYILCIRRQWNFLVNTSCDAICLILGNTSSDIFCVFAGMGEVSSTHVEMRAFLIGVWSTGVKIHFLSNLAWKAFGQPKLRYILCPRWHGVCLVTTSWEAFCFLVGKLRYRHFKIHFVSSLESDAFVQNKLR